MTKQYFSKLRVRFPFLIAFYTKIRHTALEILYVLAKVNDESILHDVVINFSTLHNIKLNEILFNIFKSNSGLVFCSELCYYCNHQHDVTYVYMYTQEQ